MSHSTHCFPVIVLVCATVASAEEITVKNSSELRVALTRLAPGVTLRLDPGTYGGGMHLRGIEGRADAPIVIEGPPGVRPAVVREGGRQALHLSDCRYVIVRRLRVEGFPSNGVNIDDGGTPDDDPHHVTLEDLTILDTGPRGNHDALKLSGLRGFVVRRCRFEGWGGSGIDMVGCHDGVIEDCRFKGKDGFSQSNAVQIKGGSSGILVATSFFDRCGQRTFNIGGSTGLRFFRPRDATYEATRVTVAGNRIVGSMAPIAWVTAQGGHVHHNTIVFPERWTLRILEETENPLFVKCRGGVFEHNLVVFDSRLRGFVNVGPNTAPETFVYRHNAWYDVDGARRPKLTAPEKDGVYQIDPKLEKVNTPGMRVTSQDPALKGIGADAYRTRRVR